MVKVQGSFATGGRAASRTVEGRSTDGGSLCVRGRGYCVGGRGQWASAVESHPVPYIRRARMTKMAAVFNTVRAPLIALPPLRYGGQQFEKQGPAARRRRKGPAFSRIEDVMGGQSLQRYGLHWRPDMKTGDPEGHEGAEVGQYGTAGLVACLVSGVRSGSVGPKSHLAGTRARRRGIGRLFASIWEWVRCAWRQVRKGWKTT
jgi:hypothetical protein